MTTDLNPLKSTGQIKNLLILTTLIEAGTGTALAFCPSATVSLLLTSSLETSAALTLGRIAGLALFALGIASWFAHYDNSSNAARGLVKALVIYNLGAVLLLGTAGIGSQIVGIALWPAVIIHAAMCLWCIISLLSKLPQAKE